MLRQSTGVEKKSRYQGVVITSGAFTLTSVVCKIRSVSTGENRGKACLVCTKYISKFFDLLFLLTINKNLTFSLNFLSPGGDVT